MKFEISEYSDFQKKGQIVRKLGFSHYAYLCTNEKRNRSKINRKMVYRRIG